MLRFKRQFETMTPPRPSVDLAATRQRLLEAAGEVFAEIGFRAATVRDICTKAGANVAAVNYHFGDKQGLYNAVFLYAHDCAMERHPVPTALAGAKPQERLRAFVGTFLNRILDDGRPAWHGKLMAREMVEQTGVLDILVGKGIRPQFEFLSATVRDLVGDLPPDVLRRCGASVVAQCLFYFHARPVIARLFPGMVFDAAEIEALTDHITAFALAGLTAAARAHAPVRVTSRSATRATNGKKSVRSSQRISKP
jgi:TetR/AcrR family transcriptional regulator, regulator of cefoperazone and chloramphenicol sensitivity